MVNQYLRQLINSIFDALFPERCFGCGAGGALLCAKCLAAAPKPEPVCFNCETASLNGVCPECARRFHIGNTRIFWATSYKYEPIRQLVRALKYRHAHAGAKILAALIHTHPFVKHSVFDNPVQHSVLHKEDNRVLLPVPMHPTRLRERGNNHAMLIARDLAKLADAPFIENGLVKTRPTHSQVAARSRAERLKNLAGSFAVHDSVKITGKNIVLIDDVLTTGATAIECAKVLRAAGASSVTVLVVAH